MSVFVWLYISPIILRLFPDFAEQDETVDSGQMQLPLFETERNEPLRN
ncbi:MAG: hypothetical protein ACUVRV_05135 [Cyanobacteriota bacterium]